MHMSLSANLALLIHTVFLVTTGWPIKRSRHKYPNQQIHIQPCQTV